MSKFKVGDMAVVLDLFQGETFNPGCPQPGQLVTITIMEINCTHPKSGRLGCKVSDRWYIVEERLKKIDPGHQPADEEFTQWLKDLSTPVRVE